MHEASSTRVADRVVTESSRSDHLETAREEASATVTSVGSSTMPRRKARMPGRERCRPLVVGVPSAPSATLGPSRESVRVSCIIAPTGHCGERQLFSEGVVPKGSNVAA
jgi:hypothetical protein